MVFFKKYYCSFQKNYFLENLKIYISKNVNACSFSGSRETRWKKILIFDSFLCNEHCMKSVKIRSFFWSVFSCIQSEYRKIQTKKNPYLDTFDAVERRGLPLTENLLGDVLYKENLKILKP